MAKDPRDPGTIDALEVGRLPVDYFKTPTAPADSAVMTYTQSAIAVLTALRAMNARGEIPDKRQLAALASVTQSLTALAKLLRL